MSKSQQLKTTPTLPKKVALLAGGWSAERDVSLNKGRDVEKALKAAGYDVHWVEVEKNLPKLLDQLSFKPDVAFNNLHGTGGEDGVVQGVLEMLQLPYTHSGVLGSAVGMHKMTTKRVAESLGIPTPKCAMANIADLAAGKVPLPKPYVIKPEAEGSSVGVFIALEGENSPAPDAKTWPYSHEVMVEEYIAGRELTVAVLDGVAQAVTEIVSATRFFDYEAKYKDTRTRTIMPAELPAAVYQAALTYSAQLYNALGCRGIGRCDWRYNEKDGLKFLELNTQPGMTPESIGPSQVIYNGYSFQDLCVHLVETASCNK